MARSRGVCIKGMHGTNGAGHHEWHIIRCPPQCQRVIRRASKWLQVQLGPLLLHPQGHELLFQVVAHGDGCCRNRGTSSSALRREAAMASPLLQQHHFVALVTFVVERRKCQDIQEQQRCTNRHCYTQLRRVVTCCLWERRYAWTLRTFWIRLCIRWVRGGNRGLARAWMIWIQERIFPARSVGDAARWW